MAAERPLGVLLLIALLVTGGAAPAYAGPCRTRCQSAIRACVARLGCDALTPPRLRRSCRRTCRVANVYACRATGECLFAE